MPLSKPPLPTPSLGKHKNIPGGLHNRRGPQKFAAQECALKAHLVPYQSVAAYAFTPYHLDLQKLTHTPTGASASASASASTTSPNSAPPSPVGAGFLWGTNIKKQGFGGVSMATVRLPWWAIPVGAIQKVQPSFAPALSPEDFHQNAIFLADCLRHTQLASSKKWLKKLVSPPSWQQRSSWWVADMESHEHVSICARRLWEAGLLEPKPWQEVQGLSVSGQKKLHHIVQELGDEAHIFDLECLGFVSWEKLLTHRVFTGQSGEGRATKQRSLRTLPSAHLKAEKLISQLAQTLGLLDRLGEETRCPKKTLTRKGSSSMFGVYVNLQSPPLLSSLGSLRASDLHCESTVQVDPLLVWGSSISLTPIHELMLTDSPSPLVCEALTELTRLTYEIFVLSCTILFEQSHQALRMRVNRELKTQSDYSQAPPEAQWIRPIVLHHASARQKVMPHVEHLASCLKSGMEKRQIFEAIGGEPARTHKPRASSL